MMTFSSANDTSLSLIEITHAFHNSDFGSCVHITNAVLEKRNASAATCDCNHDVTVLEL